MIITMYGKFLAEFKPAHSLADWREFRASTFCLLPKHTFVVAGYYDGSLRVWDILSGDYFEEIISDVPIQQICSVPHSFCICIVSVDGIVSMYNVLERKIICQWDAYEDTCVIAKNINTENSDANVKDLFIHPVSADISVVAYKLDFANYVCCFVKHFERGAHVGDSFRSTMGTANVAVSQNGKTMIRKCGAFFEIYDVPNFAWAKNVGGMLYNNYSISPDGTKVLRASANGDIVVYGVHDQTEFVWVKSDSIDLSGCDFRNSPNLDDELKTFLQMNGAII